MKRVLSIFSKMRVSKSYGAIIVVLLAACAVPAQTAPAAEELTKLLQEFLAGASRNDPNVHDRFWAPDLIYTGSGGRRRGKPDIMRDVRSAPAPAPGNPTTTFTAEDIRIHQYGDTAIVAFRLVGTTENDGKTELENYLNTGTFLRRNGTWQVVSWQSTRMARPEEEIKRETTAEVAEPTVVLPPQLARVLTDYETNWKAGDAAGLANLFTIDGYALPERRPPVKGRPAIQKLYTGRGSPLSLRAIAYSTHGDVGYIIGGYTSERGKPDEGKFTLTVQRSKDGRWLIVSDMDNSNNRR
jgi:ketosteroid isomerase-like protein